MSLEGPKAAGCLITINDLPRICSSIAVYCAMIGFGSGNAALGIIVSMLASSLGIPQTSMGQMFTCRGVGVFIGAAAAAQMMQITWIPLSKHMICSLATAGACAALVAVVVLASLQESAMMPVRAAFVLQGAAFGMIDSYSIIALSEMWGQRVQPWMQGKNLTFSIGALAAPVLIGSLPWKTGVIVSAVLGLAAFVFIFLERVLLIVYPFMGEQSADTTADGDVSKPHGADDGAQRQLEMTSRQKDPCVEPPSHTMHQRLPAIEEADQHHQQASSMGLFGRASQFVQAHVDPKLLLADEFNTLADTVQLIEQNSKDAGDAVSDLDLLVDVVLEHTQYSLLTEADRENSDFEYPHINRTLSFMPAPVAEFVRKEQAQGVSVGVTFMPPSVMLVLTVFYVVYIGLYYSYGGWIKTYVDLRGIQYIPTGYADPQPAGLFVSAMYYASLLTGSILSIPLAVVFSTTTLLRIHLFVLSLGMAALLLPLSQFVVTVVSAVFVAYGISCISGLAMTLVNDYAITMQERNAAMLVMAGCFGEAFIPVLVGQLMNSFGPEIFQILVIASVALMLLSYAALHFTLKFAMQATMDRIREEEPARSRALTQVRSRACSRVRSRSASRAQAYHGAISPARAPHADMNYHTAEKLRLLGKHSLESDHGSFSHRTSSPCPPSFDAYDISVTYDLTKVNDLVEMVLDSRERSRSMSIAQRLHV